MRADDEDEQDSKPPTIFINRIDTYFGKILSQYLGHCEPGASNEEHPDSSEKKDHHDLNFLETPGTKDCFQITGSYRVPSFSEPIDACYSPPLPPKISVVASLCRTDHEDPTQLITTLEMADIYIFHLLDENGQNSLYSDTENVLALVHKHLVATKSRKSIILVSNLMSWCKTKTAVKKKHDAAEDEEEDEDPPFTEPDNKKRRPHPNFKYVYKLEKTLLAYPKQSKGRITATVIGAGTIYGYGENIFHWWFKDAWHNTLPLKVIGDGKSHLPMIHARDLAQIVQNVCDSKPNLRYIIAVDEAISTLQEVVEGIGKSLSTPAVINLSPEDILANTTLDQTAVDILTVDLRFEAAFVKETMKVHWVAGEGFLKGLSRVVKDYKIIRNLLPIKVNLVGPPFTGRTTLAKYLSGFYKIHYVSSDSVVKDLFAELKTLNEKAAEAHDVPVLSETDPDAEADPKVETIEIPEEQDEKKPDRGAELMHLLVQIDASKAQNGGEVSHDLLIPLVREKLLSRPCQNQGYVLDGFPNSYVTAKDLFAPVEDVSQEEETEEIPEEEPKEDEGDLVDTPPHDKKIIPDFIFLLDAPEEYISQRNMNSPDDHSSHIPAEQLFKKRYAAYNVQNNEEQNLLSYYDEIENHAIWIDVTKDVNPKMDTSIMNVLKRIGKPHNYGLTEEEQWAIVIQEESNRMRRAMDEAERKRLNEELTQEKKVKANAEWKNRLELLLAEDYGRRELQAMPVHKYLFKYVFPTIHDSLLECARVGPTDPVEFIAEYLLQKSKPSRFSASSATEILTLSREHELQNVGSGDLINPAEQEIFSEQKLETRVRSVEGDELELFAADAAPFQYDYSVE